MSVAFPGVPEHEAHLLKAQLAEAEARRVASETHAALVAAIRAGHVFETNDPAAPEGAIQAKDILSGAAVLIEDGAKWVEENDPAAAEDAKAAADAAEAKAAELAREAEAAAKAEAEKAEAAARAEAEKLAAEAAAAEEAAKEEAEKVAAKVESVVKGSGTAQ